MLNQDVKRASMRLSTIVSVHKEMIPGEGEDSRAFCFRKTDAMMAVFDGCGGAGLKRYASFSGRTGAYIASRLVAQTCMDWFEGNPEPCAVYKRLPDMGRMLNARLHEAMEDAKTVLEQSGGLKLGGKLVKTLPTTLSMAILNYGQSDRLQVGFVWAGDSRGYLLTPRGLCQCTRDDIVGGQDAMENLFSDAPMNNVVNADEPFQLRVAALSAKAPCMALVATDGVFSYFQSPMDFEYFLISTLARACTPVEWEQLLYDGLCDVAADDFSLIIAVFGENSFEALKQPYLDRGKYLFQGYIEPMDRAGEDATDLTVKLWRQYKKNYYI